MNSYLMINSRAILRSLLFFYRCSGEQARSVEILASLRFFQSLRLVKAVEPSGERQIQSNGLLALYPVLYLYAGHLFEVLHVVSHHGQAVVQGGGTYQDVEVGSVHVYFAQHVVLAALLDGGLHAGGILGIIGPAAGQFHQTGLPLLLAQRRWRRRHNTNIFKHRVQIRCKPNAIELA